MSDISDSFRWLGVELRHLIAFRTVADEGSLAAAARRLGYSQPAVSQQLATLERLVGARLVARRAGGREVALTEAGQLVLRHGEAILARAQAADADLRALERGEIGELRVGTIPSVGARLVPTLLRRYAEQWPAVDVRLVEDVSDHRLLEYVEAAEVDLAFVLLPVAAGPFGVAELLADPYVLLVAADSPLAASRRPVGPRQIAKLPLIVFGHGRAHDAYLRAHGLTPEIRLSTEDNETLVGLVAAGLGAAIIPRLTVDRGRNDVVQLELTPPFAPRLLAVAWHSERDLSDAARALVELAMAVGGEMSRPARQSTAAAPSASAAPI